MFADSYGGVTAAAAGGTGAGGAGAGGYPSAVVGYGSSAVSPTSNGHFAMPPCPPAAALPGPGTAVGRGSVIQAAAVAAAAAAAAANCYQPNGNGGRGGAGSGGAGVNAGTANINDLYYMDFGAPAAAMYHQKMINNNNNNIVKNKKPKKYGTVGRPAAVGSPASGGVQQPSSCPVTGGPKRKSREGKITSVPSI